MVYWSGKDIQNGIDKKSGSLQTINGILLTWFILIIADVFMYVLCANYCTLIVINIVTIKIVFYTQKYDHKISQK